jgi:hypothetical protein
MTDDRIEKIKSAVESAENLPANKKAELLRLLSKLQPAIAKVSKTHHKHALFIAGRVEATTHEATRAKKKPQQTKTLLHELKQSVLNFEASHPELSALVTEYSAFLAALGI